jgi:hypothetical protein
MRRGTPDSYLESGGQEILQILVDKIKNNKKGSTIKSRTC